MDLKAKLKENINQELNSGVSVNDDIIQDIIQKTFLWMGGITAIVFAVGYYIVGLMKTGQIDAGQYMIAFWVSAILGLGLVFAISWWYTKMKYSTLSILTILFALAEGVGLAGVLYAYNAASVINAFAGAALLFIGMAVYGYVTKSDLTKLGTILFIGLIAIIVLGLLNAFLIHSPMMELGLAIVGLLIFLGLTAWDLQMLKLMAKTGDRRLEIVFGVGLFLNFINIFISLLRIFGSSDD